ncbi:MAG: AMP-binding protein [Deltaproteobacteria bacterium]|nr:AMP-binding protein [Deltaproteobacteria bacterium]
MAQNLIDLLIRNAREFPKRPALREKRYGVWTPTTWKQLAEEVAKFARGLKILGLGKNEAVAVVGDNKPEWIIAELGTIASGGVITGMYPDCLAEEVLYLISYADARIIVLSDQEQVDKILKVWPKISGAVKAVIVWDSRGMSHYYAAHSFLKRFEEVLEMGAEEGKNHPDSLQQAAGDVPPGTPAMMLTTSGTTALPKLAILSHESLLFAGESYGKVVSMEPEDQLLSLAPLPWIGEQLYAVVRWLLSGACYNFPEEPETLRRDLIELQPSYFGGTPSRWEDLVSVIQAAMDNADPLKKNLYGWAVRTALKRTEDELAGKDPGLWAKFLFGLLNFSVLRALRNRVGLGRVKMAVTGGGALSPEVFKYFKSLGIDIRQVYGQTECAGIATTHRDGDVRPETVGVPIPGMEVKLSEQGEIMVRGKSIMLGYYKNEKATQDAFTPDGFLRTGDAGYFGEDGHLYIFDRFKDIMALADGSRFAPQDIEIRLKFSPYIKEAVVCGANQPFVTAIISIDLENVGNWAKRRGIPYTTYQDLSQRPEVYELVREEIRKLCQRFPQNMRVRKFAILLKELHPDDEELTRTRKVRRGLIYERYKPLIEDLYQPTPEHLLDIQIRYEDGRISSLKGRVAIAEVTS